MKVLLTLAGGWVYVQELKNVASASYWFLLA